MWILAVYWTFCWFFACVQTSPISFPNKGNRRRLHAGKLVFSVTPFKIDENKNEDRSIDKAEIKFRIWEMEGGKYAKTLAKIQVRGIFRIRDIRRNVLPKFIEICMETPCWSSSRWAPTWRTETNNVLYETHTWHKQWAWVTCGLISPKRLLDLNNSKRFSLCQWTWLFSPMFCHAGLSSLTFLAGCLTYGQWCT